MLAVSRFRLFSVIFSDIFVEVFTFSCDVFIELSFGGGDGVSGSCDFRVVLFFWGLGNFLVDFVGFNRLGIIYR